MFCNSSELATAWGVPAQCCSVMEVAMPAVSQAQQRAAGAALAAKRGEIPVKELKGPSRDMYKSMSETELERMASAKSSRLPEHKDE